MANEFHHITIKLMPDNETPINKDVESFSVFMRMGFNLNLTRIVGQLDENVKKDESLGHIWQNVKSQNGKYLFEIGTELPYYLPNINGKAEYILNIGKLTCFVCNRMVRAFWGDGFPGQDDKEYFLIHLQGVPSIIKKGQYKNIHILHMRTFISSKHEVKASTAEEAINQYFIQWRKQLLAHIWTIIISLKTVMPEKTKQLFPYPTLASYPIFWISVTGEGGKVACEQIGGDIQAVALRPILDLNDENSSQFIKQLSENEMPQNYQIAISFAITFCHYGHYEQALVQICTACQIILSKALEKYLVEKGLSKNQIVKAMEDVTFSQLLNLHVFNFCEIISMKDYENVIGQANWARKRRNEIVHSGKSGEKLTKENVGNVIEAIKTIIKQVESRLQN